MLIWIISYTCDLCKTHLSIQMFCWIINYFVKVLMYLHIYIMAAMKFILCRHFRYICVKEMNNRFSLIFGAILHKWLSFFGGVKKLDYIHQKKMFDAEHNKLPKKNGNKYHKIFTSFVLCHVKHWIHDVHSLRSRRLICNLVKII